MNERWIKDMHDRFADFEKPAPEGLLADVQGEMQRRGLVPVKGKTRRMIPVWARVAAVAAAVALVLGIGTMLLPTYEPAINSSEVPAIVEAQPIHDHQPKQEAPVEQQHETQTFDMADRKDYLADQVVVQQHLPITLHEQPLADNKVVEAVEMQEVEAGEAPASARHPEVSSGAEEDSNTSIMEPSRSVNRSNPMEQQQPANSRDWSGTRRSQSHKWQIGVHASGLRGVGTPSYSYLNYNSMLSKAAQDFFVETVGNAFVPNGDQAQNRVGTDFVGVAGGNASAGEGASADEPNRNNPQFEPVVTPTTPAVSNSSNFVYTRFQNDNSVFVYNQLSHLYMKADHRLPVKVGLSLRYHFNHRWSVQAGIDYSYHSSDLISQIENSQIQSEQKLHFLGIPMALSYSIWSPGRFNFYLTAGGEIEKVIQGSRTSLWLAPGKADQVVRENIEEKPWQFSFVGSGGIQFNINRLLGIYAEPGVAYYFDNKSTVPTIYQEKPFNFNLNVGLRFNINSK